MKPMISASEILEMEQQIDTLNAMLPHLVESYEVRAKIKYEKYQALVMSGFSEDQAIGIVIAGGSGIEL